MGRGNVATAVLVLLAVSGLHQRCNAELGVPFVVSVTNLSHRTVTVSAPDGGHGITVGAGGFTVLTFVSSQDSDFNVSFEDGRGPFPVPLAAGRRRRLMSTATELRSTENLVVNVNASVNLSLIVREEQVTVTGPSGSWTVDF